MLVRKHSGRCFGSIDGCSSWLYLLDVVGGGDGARVTGGLREERGWVRVIAVDIGVDLIEVVLGTEVAERVVRGVELMRWIRVGGVWCGQTARWGLVS